MRYNVTSPLSTIKCIVATFSPYKTSSIFKDTGRIYIDVKYLNQKLGLQAILNSNPYGFVFSINSMHPYSLISSDIENFRNIVDYLYSKDLINNTDRANIEDEIRIIEKNVSISKKVENTVTDGQIEVVKFMCDEHIDLLIKSLVQSPDDVNDVLGFLDAFPGAYKGYYNFKDWLTKNHKCDSQQLNDIMESYEYLAKTYKGLAGLESTFIKQGTGVPTLEIQQGIKKDLIQSRVEEMFNNKSTELGGVKPL